MTLVQQTPTAARPTASFTVAASVIALLAGPVVVSIGLIYSGYGEPASAVEVSEQVFMFDDGSVFRCEILPGEEVCLDRFDPNG